MQILILYLAPGADLFHSVRRREAWTSQVIHLTGSRRGRRWGSAGEPHRRVEKVLRETLHGMGGARGWVDAHRRR